MNFTFTVNQDGSVVVSTATGTSRFDTADKATAAGFPIPAGTPTGTGTTGSSGSGHTADPAPAAAPAASAPAPATPAAASISTSTDPTPAKVAASAMSDRLRDFAAYVAEDIAGLAAIANEANEALDAKIETLRSDIETIVTDRIQEAFKDVSEGGPSVFEDVDLVAHYKAARAGGSTAA